MKYKKIVYPDGQISAEILEVIHPYVITERINSYADLFFIKSLSEALDYKNIKNRHLKIPCLFGQRSDRRFGENNSFDLKIIANFINSCGFMDVEILDPHSDVSLALINNAKKRSSFEFVKRAIEDINQHELVLVAPDAGAYKKVWEYANALNQPLVAAVKHRDKDGNVDLRFTGNVNNKDCLIVDDLCDGGYTFIQLAEKLHEQGAGFVYLYISHAYFSKGIDPLIEHIAHIYCTNSVKDVQHPHVTQYKVV